MPGQESALSRAADQFNMMMTASELASGILLVLVGGAVK